MLRFSFSVRTKSEIYVTQNLLSFMLRPHRSPKLCYANPRTKKESVTYISLLLLSWAGDASVRNISFAGLPVEHHESKVC